jgi:hypothetical protein
VLLICYTKHLIRSLLSPPASSQFLHSGPYRTLVTIILRLFQEQFANQKAGSSCSKDNEVPPSLPSQVR